MANGGCNTGISGVGHTSDVGWGIPVGRREYVVVSGTIGTGICGIILYSGGDIPGGG